ncbi:MAG: hypothetical protein CMM91_11015 [Rickettsiales bacterium]|nr:hypothetical protein [Rickettsiales bacterium]OUV52995.1 MAG: hypothetical protein CBC87_06500 [Rickettsiales bacterium TMED127]|tara:strand:- start:92606 stop:92881 length:276 start_codon:yes stop_codon:yes gene_type:complete
MPEIKIIVNKDEYTLQCEEGEEDELTRAVKIVNQKMDIFKDEVHIQKKTKLLMVAILLASEYNERKDIITKQESILKDVEKLIQKLEKNID